MNKREPEEAAVNLSGTNLPSASPRRLHETNAQGSRRSVGLSFVPLKGHSRVLWQTGVMQIALLALELPGLAFDHRTVSGINPWIKPIKFDLSIAVYCWTMARMLAPLSVPFAHRISNRISLCMVVEIAVITFQAARGVKSHFNASTRFDFAMYGVMGLFILYNTYLMVRVTVEYFTAEVLSLPPVLLRGVQLGLVLGLIGSGVGGVMVGHGRHAVGIPDGGAGLPFFNWSTQGGDLRIAHFLGLHELQFMPIAGYLLAAPKLRLSAQARMKLFYVCFVFYLMITASAFVWAYLGHPLFTSNSR